MIKIVYASGKSEIAMGKAIKKYNWSRSSLVVTTKIYWGGSGVNERGLSRKHIIEGLNASLKRLDLEYVDVVYAHRPDQLTPMEEVVRAFNWVIEKGLAFYWGTSEWSAEEIMDAQRVAERLGLIGPICEQPQYNMFEREKLENEYLPLFKKTGLGTTIWSPLASGVLTGKYLNGIPKDSRLETMAPSFVKDSLIERLKSEEGKKRNEKVKSLAVIADKVGCTLSQLAIAWCVKNPNVSTVITGASRPSQVTENMKSIEVSKKLTPEIMKEIDSILDNVPKVPVARY